MKVIVSLILVCLMTAGGSFAQNATQRYLIEHLRIYYIAQPNAATGSQELLDNQQIFAGNESGPFWSNSQMSHAQTLVRGLLKEQEQGGDQSLQYFTTSIARILNKKVKILLYNDTAAPLNAHAEANFDPCPDRNNYVWPCARSYKANESASRHWAGYMHMGAKNMNDRGIAWTKATFLHELVHTQDQSENRAHVFYSFTADQWYHYGADRAHRVLVDTAHNPIYTEAVPSIVSAYKEGIANTISLLYDRQEAMRFFQWFATNGRMMVEVTNDPAATDIPQEAWLYNVLQNAGLGNGSNIPGRSSYRAYRVRSLTPRFIVHNEFIQALIFSKYVEHINLTRFINAIKQANRHLSRSTAPTVAVLFRELCDAGLENGETFESVSAQSHDRPKRYLLPLAYADYFTSYGATTKDEFMAMFENGSPIQGWVDLYWDYYKDGIRNAVPASNPQVEDLTNIASALDIQANVGN